MFPPIPPWSGMHPLVVHFPIALLLVAPVLLVVSLLSRKHRLTWLTAALLLTLLGTTAAWVATATGEATEQAVDLPDGVSDVLTHHEDLAELARNVFSGTTLLLAALVVLVYRLPKLRHRYFAAAVGVMLCLNAAGALILANAAHEGGRLVHQFGVRSPVAETVATRPAD